MKKALFIFLLFLFACQQENKNTLAFLNEGIERCNEEISIFNNGYIAQLEVNFLMNPAKSKSKKNDADNLTQKSKKIFSLIEEINEEIIKDTDGNLSLDKKSTLHKHVSDYKSFIDSFTTANPLFDNEIKRQITAGITNPEISKHADMNILSNEIQVLNYMLLKNIYQSSEEPIINYNKYRTVVIPYSVFLYPGETYEAAIFLSAYSANFLPVIIIENDTLPSEKGYAIYTINRNNSIGEIKKNGRLEIPGFLPENKQVIPFEINYQVVKRK